MSTRPRPPRSLSDVLRASAARFADRPALRTTTTALSYAELDACVDALGTRLQDAGAVPGTRVGLCVERGPLALVASAALMRLGCAYVPLEPGYPIERLRHVLAGSGMELAVCDEPGAATLRSTPLSLVAVGPDDLDRAGSAELPGPGPGADAYVMYTSGTTGLPKGVPVTHANLLALLADAVPLFAFGEHEVWPLQHAHGFDVSVWEMWAGISVGATLLAVEGAARHDPERLADLLLRGRATRLHIVPSVFAQLAEVAWEQQLRVPLRAVTFCGEAVNYRALRTWAETQRGDPVPAWYNAYGITETTVYNTVKVISPAEVELADPATPIGRGYPNSPVVVLDDRLGPVPPGGTGEVFVGGAQVARGYLGNPELTAQRFLKVPGRPGRWYRTGDHARVDTGGELGYLGRVDDQVKIRGFRIELGELDHAARALPWIADAAAVVDTSARGEPCLTLFVVSQGEVGDPVARLRRDLSARLPEYMLPGRVVLLPRLPRNTNGKRDRQALREQLAR